MALTAEICSGEARATATQSDRTVVLLCAPELRPRYDAILSTTGHMARAFDCVEMLLAECVQRPPLAILLDMNAVTRLGAMATAPLFELDIDWPILRCTVLGDAGANYMCLDPLRFGALTEALSEIAACDPQWQRASRRRDAIRLDLACRVRLRRDGETAWAQANCLDISVSGMFAVTYRPYEIGETVDLELRDLGPTPYHLRGKVVRAKLWDADPNLPGIGVRFLPETVAAAFRAQLARPENIQRLMAGCRKRGAVATEPLVNTPRQAT